MSKPKTDQTTQTLLAQFTKSAILEVAMESADFMKGARTKGGKALRVRLLEIFENVRCDRFNIILGGMPPTNDKVYIVLGRDIDLASFRHGNWHEVVLDDPVGYINRSNVALWCSDFDAPASAKPDQK